MRLFITFFFFFNDTATTEIYTLSLHDALPISRPGRPPSGRSRAAATSPRRARGARPRHRSDARCGRTRRASPRREDRKSTRLNSSHVEISYAVFCLKKKKKKQQLMRLDDTKTT